MALLETIGEKVPYTHDLPPLGIAPVRDLHQINNNTFKPNTTKSKSVIGILPLKKPQYLRPFRPEGGIIINNTENI